MRFHAGHKLTRAKRLRHIIIRSKAQTSDFINIVFFGRNHNNRRILLISDLTAYFKTVNSREHQIKNNQVKISAQSFLQTCISVIRHFHLKVAQFKIIFLKIRNTLFILYDQNTLTHQ